MRSFIEFLQAILGLTLYDLALCCGGFRRVHRIVARWKIASHTPDPGVADQVVNAVNLACIWYPKQALCLQRSAVTVCLMRSRGLKAEWVLGAQKMPFAAHAWVELAGKAVNERSNVQARFTVWERC